MILPKPTKREKISKPIRRGKRPSRVRKTPLGKMRNAADKLIGDIVRARGRCEAADVPLKREQGCTAVLQWCHGFSRRYMATRWDLRNGFCMCSGHHSYFTPRPSEWEQWMQGKLGMTVYLELQAKRGKITPIRAEELRALITAETGMVANA